MLVSPYQLSAFVFEAIDGHLGRRRLAALLDSRAADLADLADLLGGARHLAKIFSVAQLDDLPLMAAMIAAGHQGQTGDDDVKRLANVSLADHLFARHESGWAW